MHAGPREQPELLAAAHVTGTVSFMSGSPNAPRPVAAGDPMPVLTDAPAPDAEVPEATGPPAPMWRHVLIAHVAAAAYVASFAAMGKAFMLGNHCSQRESDPSRCWSSLPPNPSAEHRWYAVVLVLWLVPLLTAMVVLRGYRFGIWWWLVAPFVGMVAVTPMIIGLSIFGG